MYGNKYLFEHISTHADTIRVCLYMQMYVLLYVSTYSCMCISRQRKTVVGLVLSLANINYSYDPSEQNVA